MSPLLEVRWCSQCRADQPFEVPPCADDHGADCPDLACTGCGSAVVAGWLAAEPGGPSAADSLGLRGHAAAA